MLRTLLVATKNQHDLRLCVIDLLIRLPRVSSLVVQSRKIVALTEPSCSY